MRGMSWRRIIHRAAAALVVAAVVVWFATGRASYTRFPDARRTALAPLQQQDENFWPGGIGESSASQTVEFPNRFMLGLLPSGGGRYLLSVSILSAVSLCVFLLSRKSKVKVHGKSTRQIVE